MAYAGTAKGSLVAVTSEGSKVFLDGAHDGLTEAVDVWGSRLASDGTDGMIVVADTESGSVVRHFRTGIAGHDIAGIDEDTLAYSAGR